MSLETFENKLSALKDKHIVDFSIHEAALKAAAELKSKQEQEVQALYDSEYFPAKKREISDLLLRECDSVEEYQQLYRDIRAFERVNLIEASERESSPLYYAANETHKEYSFVKLSGEYQYLMVMLRIRKRQLASRMNSNNIGFEFGNL